MKLYELIPIDKYDYYIKELDKLEIGLELTARGATEEDIKKIAKRLRKRINDVGMHFDESNGGYWGPNQYDEYEGFNWIREHIESIAKAGFKRITIHAPLYFRFMGEHFNYLKDAREKLKQLVKIAAKCGSVIYVENIRYPKYTISPRFEIISFVDNTEDIINGTGAKMLLDVWHTGGAKATVKRLKSLRKKKINVPILHFHWSHMFLPVSDLKMIKDSGFNGTIINEGYIKDFDPRKVDFLSAKDHLCSPKEIIKRLAEYKKVL